MKSGGNRESFFVARDDREEPKTVLLKSLRFFASTADFLQSEIL